MKLLILLFIALTAVPIALHFAGREARLSIWQVAKPVMKFATLAAVAVYLLLTAFHAVGSIKLL